METSLQLATIADAGPIAVMSRRLIESGLPWSWRPARVAKHIRGRDSLVLAGRLDQHLIGFAIMYFGQDTAHLNLLAVDTAYQRCGLGQRLVHWLEKSAVVAGTFIISLEVRERNYVARRFYRRLGYEETGRLSRYYGGSEDAVRMSHDLRLYRMEHPEQQRA